MGQQVNRHTVPGGSGYQVHVNDDLTELEAVCPGSRLFVGSGLHPIQDTLDQSGQSWIIRLTFA